MSSSGPHKVVTLSPHFLKCFRSIDFEQYSIKTTFYLYRFFVPLPKNFSPEGLGFVLLTLIGLVHIMQKLFYRTNIVIYFDLRFSEILFGSPTYFA